MVIVSIRSVPFLETSLYRNPDNFEYEDDSKFIGGTFQKVPTICGHCQEHTFKTIDDGYAVCQGCMFKEKHKEKNRIRQREDPDVISDSSGPYYVENAPLVEAQFEAVMGRIHKLSPMEKQVIELLWENKTQEEVAEILSISRGEVSTYLKRARIKLK